MEDKQTYTLEDLAEFYNVSPRTIYNWLLPIRNELLAMNQLRRNRLRTLMPRQVKRIKEFLG